jgi:hypothetical protein
MTNDGINKVVQCPFSFLQAESVFDETGNGDVHLDIHLAKPSGTFNLSNIKQGKRWLTLTGWVAKLWGWGMGG